MTTELMTTSHPPGMVDNWRSEAKKCGLTLSAWVRVTLQASIGSADERQRVGRPKGVRNTRKRDTAK